MARINLSKMDAAELTQLRADVDKALADYEDRRRQEARAALEEQAKSMGFTLSELLGGAKAKGKAGNKKPAKYRHPENPAQTWSGRGRQPGWIKDHLASGGALEDYLIG